MIDKSAVKAKGSPQLMRRAVRVSPIAVLTAIVAACGGDGSDHDTFSTRDSAGVKIVESMEALWAEGEGWRLSAEPSLTIGVDEGPEEYSLFQVTAALRLPNGNIVIANSGTDELRYYDSSGSYLYSAGQDGYGPGEFKDMSGMWLVLDTLVIGDPGQDRVSVFSATGEYVRTLMLDREPGSLTPDGAGVFADASILGRELTFDRQAASQSGPHFLRFNSIYRRYSPDGAVLDSLGVFLLDEHVLETVKRSTDPATGAGYASIVGSGAPFGRSASVIAHGNHVYYGSSNSYEIQVFTKEGKLERLIRRPIPNPPVTQQDRERFRDDWLEGGSDWERRRVNDLEFPDTKPAYGRVKVDALGNVWMEEYTWPHEDKPEDWTVFDADGRMLGIVEVPRNGSIFEIGEDYLLGAWRTELDVEQVRMYRLFRN